MDTQYFRYMHLSTCGYIKTNTQTRLFFMHAQVAYKKKGLLLTFFLRLGEGSPPVDTPVKLGGKLDILSVSAMPVLEKASNSPKSSRGLLSGTRGSSMLNVAGDDKTLALTRAENSSSRTSSPVRSFCSLFLPLSSDTFDSNMPKLRVAVVDVAASGCPSSELDSTASTDFGSDSEPFEALDGKSSGGRRQSNAESALDLAALLEDTAGEVVEEERGEGGGKDGPC